MAYSTLFQAWMASLLLAAAFVSAQVTPSISTDPLSGTTFSTPVYNPPKTYTIVTTYSSNLPVTQTIISGSAGPSPATGSYAYTYSAPLQSASGTDQASLFSSLKANGEPTAYTSSLAPDPNNLQIVDGAHMLRYDTLATFSMMAAAAVAGAAFIL